MKSKLMTEETIKEIESLIPDHEQALILYGADLYRKGMIKGAVVAGIGTAFGMIVNAIKHVDTEKNNSKD